LENTEIIELKDFYVYLLMNKEDKKVFYVGKGKGERAYEHEKEASNQNETDKHKKINELKEKNSYEVIVIGRYQTAAEAFAVESTLIHWVYGKNNLTNEQSGHGSDSVREKDDYSEKEGIDIPKKLYLNDGSYTIEQLDDRNKNQIIRFMNNLKCELENKTDYKFSDIDIKQSRFTRIYLDIGDFKINIGTTNSAAKKVFFEVTHKNKDTDRIVELSNKTNFEIKNHGEWCKLNLPATSDMDKILEYLECYKSILEKYLGI